MSRAPTGGAARERLEEKLNQACSKSTELEQKIQKLQQVAKKLSSQELLNGENVAGFELMSKLGLDNADPFLSEALPNIVTNACEDYPNQDGEPFAGDFWNRPVPAQALLQYTYSYLKDIQEAYKKTREKYTKLQAQFAKLTDKLDSIKAKRKQHAPRKLPPLQACVWFRDLVEEGVEPQPGPRVKNKLRNWYALVTLNIGGRSSMWNFLSHARDTGAEILCIQEHKREIDEMQKLLVQVGAATTHWVAVAAAWGLMPELAEL